MNSTAILSLGVHVYCIALFACYRCSYLILMFFIMMPDTKWLWILKVKTVTAVSTLQLSK